MIEETHTLRTLLMADLELRDDIEMRHHMGEISELEKHAEINEWREKFQKSVNNILRTE